ncbi:anti-sigma factor domain-containing protein [Kineococcus sp. SYSU DK006]|uniref:anti-sigma factor n=1 Tax=Kineococcus sp. SYSU DK006 TaxID=3383127 RepID=UPI003D7C74F6
MSDQGRHPGDDPLLAGAWALDALDEDERAGYEERLRRHPEERADAESLRAAAARLGEAEAVAPPAHLRGAVLAAIAGTPQEPGGPQEPARTQEGQRPQVVDLAAERTRRRGPSRWSVLVAAAGVVVAAVGVGVGVGQRGEQQVVAQPSAAQRAAELLTAPGARVSTVAASSGGTATVVRAGQQVAVLTTGLPAAGAGRDYQLWLVSGDALTSAGMLRVSADGSAATVVDAPSVDAVGISVEPAAGSQQPTTTPVVLAPLGA